MNLPVPSEYPTHIKIRDTEYEIKFVKTVPGGGRNYRKVAGLCDPGEQIIYIRENLGVYETFSTIIHEVLHAIESEWDIKMEHKLVYQLEHCLTEILVTNF